MTLSKAKKEREIFLEGMGRLIKYFEVTFEILGEKDSLPEGYRSTEDDICADGVPSLGQMVAMLNEHRHGTRYNKKWTRHSLRLLLEELNQRGVETNIGHKHCKTERANRKRSHQADQYALEVYEDHLKNSDFKHMTNSEIARHLNKRGSKTIRGNDWSPAGCGKLLARLERLE